MAVLGAAELRGWVSRKLVAEDGRWVADASFSSQSSAGAGSAVALLLDTISSDRL